MAIGPRRLISWITNSVKLSRLGMDKKEVVAQLNPSYSGDIKRPIIKYIRKPKMNNYP